MLVFLKIYIYMHLPYGDGCSCCCVVCSCYECLLSWVGSILYKVCVCVCCYLMFNSCDVSNIDLYMSMYSPFMCNLFLLFLCMWYFSNVLRCFPYVFMMFNLSVILPYACSMLSV
jgi:hypothetical protein